MGEKRQEQREGSGFALSDYKMGREGETYSLSFSLSSSSFFLFASWRGREGLFEVRSLLSPRIHSSGPQSDIF